MHTARSHKRKFFAGFFLLLFGFQTFWPGIAYAITSGPAQPEMQAFQAANTNDLVDLFTGDLKYNIPLLDIGGYPVNLAYQSGTGMEEEATWVGTGWTLNPGAVNRDLRGLPDDFNGEKGDKIRKQYYRKPFKKVGGKVILKGTFLAHEIGSASVSLNVYKDNYYGIGASLGASLGFSLGKNTSGPLTAGIGLDLNTDVRDGASITPNMSLTAAGQTGANNNTASLSGSFTYNTRAGLKSVDLGLSFQRSNAFLEKMGGKQNGLGVSSSAVRYFGQSYCPTIENNISNDQKSLNFDVGGAFFGGYGGVGGGGYYYHETIRDNDVSVPAYGYLNYLSGRKKTNFLLDFNREKDGVFIPGTPAIAVPVATQDYFMATSQMGSQQFRPYYGGNYVVFDKSHTNESAQAGLGGTVGIGNLFQAGGRVDAMKGQTETKKWQTGNEYLASSEANFSGAVGVEPVYFKGVGERSHTDEAYYNLVGQNTTQKVVLNGRGGATTYLTSRNNGTVPTQNMVRQQRDVRSNNFSFLTAEQASKYGLDKTIKSYSYHPVTAAPQPATPINRIDGTFRKAHHISEITTTGADGNRMVYGIPVYNNKQTDETFSVDPPTLGKLDQARRSGIIQFSNAADYRSVIGGGNRKGRDNLYTNEEMPAYATSYLLTGMLSPDYVDVTGDGITDDDLGTAVKFNYTRVTSDYQWRAPFEALSANYNEGYLSDPKDDKASVSSGSKEIWNLASIESKTMIAIFSTSDRLDGFGVNGLGGINTSVPLRKLDKIALYTKATWLAAVQSGTVPTPVKTVNFEYDYSLYPEILNNSGYGMPADPNNPHGKLTLKKVYFTFGSNSRGRTNPYEFSYYQKPINLGGEIPYPSADNGTYKAEREEHYTQRQSDRWGSYKQSWYNNLQTGAADRINNSEFPYSLQKNNPQGYAAANWQELLDGMVSKWQLNTIITPAGSRIQITYETDDYAYVQDRKAMQMCFLSNPDGSSNIYPGLPTSDDIYVKLPQPVNDASEFIKKYLTGIDKLFYKVFTNIDGRGHWEYVHGYASIDISGCRLLNNSTGIIHLQQLAGYNPIAKGAWQTLRSDLPQFAYDNYDNSDVGDGAAAIKSIVSTFTNLREFFIPFDKHAKNSGFASQVNPAKSMVRLCCPNGKKTGGGSRVKSVTISDEWAIMNQGQTGTFKTASYGQVYEYIMEGDDGNPISSGVASYEPQIGNEENPFHEPVNFTEKVYWSSDRYHFIEKPFCESYFPAPGVGYSKVTVTSTGDDNAKETGFVENEFFTAKDFPTVIDNLTLDQNKYQSSLILQLFTSTSIQKTAVSQGFKIELNDMHGKPKSVKVHNKGGDIISQTDYSYNVSDKNAQLKELNNTVDVLQKDGSITPVMMNTDIDMVTDVRESNSDQTGTGIGGYGGTFLLYIPPFLIIGPIPYAGINLNMSITSSSYKSVCAVKVIHRFGILKTVRTMQNGSTLTAENLLWDGQTGEVLLTRNQNEYDNYTYSFTYPAYMAYEGMGEAYKNLGTIFPDFSTNSNGVIKPSVMPYLFPGDELVSLTGNQKGWVLAADDDKLRLIDENGEFIQIAGTFMVLRSGRRNLLTAGAGSVVLMKDPRENGILNLGVDKKVLDAKAVLYETQWSMPVSYCQTCPEGYTLSKEGTCIKDTAARYIPPDYQVCKAAEHASYSSCGSYIYTSYNRDGSFFNRSRIPVSNSFWIGDPSDQRSQCASAPSNTSPVAGLASPATNTRSGDTASKVVTHQKIASYAGPLNRCGVWTCDPQVNGSQPPVGRWIGFSRTITIGVTKQYYIGMAADNQYRFKIDGTIINEKLTNDLDNFKIWHIYPVNFTSGTHIIEMEGWNSGNVASMGAEIYDNTATEIQAATDYNQLNLIFSTKELFSPPGQFFQSGVWNCPTGYALNTQTNPYSCRAVAPLTGTQVNPFQKINPYFNNILGVWRPQTNFVYTVNRDQTPGLTAQNGGTDIRKNGFYTTYTPFWTFSGSGLQSAQLTQKSGEFDILSILDKRWVWANQSIYFDQKSNEVESRDALNRYGAALYGYNQTVAVAIGANARHNEIAYDGFEDYGFRLSTVAACPVKRQLDWEFSTGASISSETAHTGRYSFKLTSRTFISCDAGAANPTSPFFGLDPQKHYQLRSNEQGTGFSPVQNKKYILSMWVNEDGGSKPSSNKIFNLRVNINGASVPLSTTSTYVIEGWKRVEVAFTTPATVSTGIFQLEMLPSGTVYLDDIRILPFDGQLSSSVYDARNMRLVAQLDENNFATFYEYDDEGTPIRVKRETEKGIVTLKENRQSLRKR